MSTATARLLAMMDDDDPFGHAPGEIVPLQLAAIDERLAERRTQIRVLDQRAKDIGTGGISTLADLVPLLFSHTTYKSYPEAFLRDGRWDRMSLWLSTLSTHPIAGVDLAGVADIDEWMNRLHAAGHYVVSSSGTSGKCSLLNQSAADKDATSRVVQAVLRWVFGMDPAQDRPCFLFSPSRGAHRFVDCFSVIGSLYGRPGGVHYLSDRPALASENNRLGSLRRAIADGRATPSQITELETFAAERQGEMVAAMDRLVALIHAHRHEPIVIFAMWSQHWQLIEALRARGVPDGDFHPDSAMLVGGGLKGAALPDGYEAEIRAFYGHPDRFQNAYGMAELTSFWFPSCTARRHHVPPWVVPLVLDKAGEQLLNPPVGAGGQVNGRMALFDVSVDARWGGIITGDNVDVDFSPCTCGRPSPTIMSIVRYTDLPEGDDKLTCAGTMDSYVRGVMS